MESTSSNQEPETLSTTNSQNDLVPIDNINVVAPKRGEIRKGTIIRISSDEIRIDIGYKSEGIVSQHEVSKLSDSELKTLKSASQVMIYVLRGVSQDKPIVLSLLKAKEVQDWEQAKQRMIAKSIHTGDVLELNQGGVIVEVGNLRVFLPSSCMNLEHKVKNKNPDSTSRWDHIVGKQITYKILQVDQNRNKLIISERAAQKEVQKKRRENLLSSIEVNQVCTGKVVSLEQFGAFVDIGGIDGLVHKSEIAWKRIIHPSAVLKIGQEIEVLIVNLDLERERIELSLKALQQNPWDNIQEIFQEGQLVYATVNNVTKFGVFASLRDYDAIEGFVHITELSNSVVKHPEDVVTIGEEVIVRITNIDKDKQRIRLSLKEVKDARFEDLDYCLYMEAAHSS